MVAVWACAGWLLSGAGSRPGGRGTFLCFAKEKYPKERRPYCACPSAALRATCDARSAGAAAELTTRWRAPFKHAAASQSTKCVCPAAHARTRRPALLGTHRRERGTSRAIAALGPVLGVHCALQAPQREARAMRAERSNGPCAAVHPLLAAPAAGCLRGAHACRRTRMPRALTRRGCPNGALPSA